ncbi:rhodanese domain-containing protein CG4456-like isoform X1 [Amblyomma americanum]
MHVRGVRCANTTVRRNMECGIISRHDNAVARLTFFALNGVDRSAASVQGPADSCRPKMTEVKAKFPELTFQQVKAVLKDKNRGVVVDVREPKELREDGSIPGSINVPLGDVQTAFEMDPGAFKSHYHADKPDPAKDIIFSCRSGRRALMAAEKLQELGTYHNIKVYPGSFQNWVLQGGDFNQAPLTEDSTQDQV